MEHPFENQKHAWALAAEILPALVAGALASGIGQYGSCVFGTQPCGPTGMGLFHGETFPSTAFLDRGVTSAPWPETRAGKAPNSAADFSIDRSSAKKHR